ncbi:exodeoxyribonuclease III [Mariprofundus ferrooxydans]|uniref:AP endonuclease, family 1:Exodeoxyribonuclease III xth n=1 Tax=Mariprofundus ferrooxydans PV-1 TaxID=314345 RepID=Q0F2X9_9PROT|nr:exodeoxyribonuclease III [Mariprofundus ferrooxydans]EAU56162.1 AP endonuclease, family 1:Exodeoxyribonuclease III xth [Mariprofundus ferrooxydans PV-1]KON48070.1 exodeoxyribonuclease III [Mariprofundus ferrooxydans]
MKIITANLNGIRSATRKGFWEWFAAQDADILCLQELKAHIHQLPPESLLKDYHRHYHFAQKPGYSGVALYSRKQPDTVHVGLGSIDPATDWSRFDAEGRFVMTDFGTLSVISAYFPSGSGTPERQAGKMVFLEQFLPLITRLKDQGRELIICGDINIAHRNIDLKNWRGNRKNSGFLPEERAWFDQCLNAGFVDLFRQLYPEREQYSWWSNRGQARANNVGWRIDYHLCTQKTAATACEVSVFTDAWFSDHAPVTANFNDLST